MNAKQLYEMAERLLTKRSSLLNLWQEIAENFYPERADFTFRRSLGTEFADNLTTSYPVLVRRDLGNAFGSMLRPAEKSWFYMSVQDPYGDSELKDQEALAWLQRATAIQRRAMYDTRSQFARASTEGDHDFATFGQCVISIEMNRARTGLLYRNWHLRDMAWAENEEGLINTIVRRWKPTARDLVRIFGSSKVHEDTARQAEKEPFAEADCRHIVVDSELYTEKTFSTPYVSLYYDVEHEKVLEVVGVYWPIYVIPRWTTVSGSQYAFSPATVAGLPDGRLLQAMTYTLLEAGEKQVNPPMIAVQEAIRSDISIYAGGITWADSAYDERLGEVLRPITQDKSSMPLGIDLVRDTRMMLAEAFFLNKLDLPQRGPEMTAYEVGQRVQQYIRDALPLFGPMESNYNGAICEATFELMFRNGAFGSPLDIPKALRGADVQFRFESPLHEAIEREKASHFLEAGQYIASSIQLDPTTAFIVDARKALRETLNAVGVPATWINDEATVQAMVKQQQDAQQASSTLEGMQQGADVVKTLSDAGVEIGGGTGQ